MADTKSAAADPKTDLEKLITGARIVTMQFDGYSQPALAYKGTKPAKGTVLRARLNNGVIYTGTVAKAVEVDGELRVEFKDGLAPDLPPKAEKVPEPDTEVVYVTTVSE